MKSKVFCLALVACMLLTTSVADARMTCDAFQFRCSALIDGHTIEWCCPWFTACGPASVTVDKEGDTHTSSGGCVGLFGGDVVIGSKIDA